MIRRVIHDSGNLIWFNYEDITIDELDNLVISNFDISNVPVSQTGYDILGYPKISPKHIEMNNYYVTFFTDSKSSTGYSCMCINKNRNIYKSKAGYAENGKPKCWEF